ncbi:hypothetical protein M231_06637 [Tremella mesenterica]|uniref:Nucleoporin NSP1 n=1 Tax=Tremella mesenterica TaxID=5217 RepID=A0A4Q1BBF7_TREME|nr:hypothetical protein M231_06637 [Tremella mesenterica]
MSDSPFSFGSSSTPTFGATANTTTNTNPFGSTTTAAPSTNNAAGNMFGNPTTQPTSSLFGNTSTTPSSFSFNTSNAPAPNTNTTFGASSSNTTLGAPATTSNTNTTSGGFGGFGQLSSNTTNQNPTTPVKSPFSFGATTTTTPAAPPPTTSFGLNNTNPAPTQATNSFGFSAPVENKAGPTTNLFGSSGGFSFGNKTDSNQPAAPATPAPAPAANSTGTMFGSTTPAAPPSSLFSFGNAASTSTSTDKPAESSLFSFSKPADTSTQNTTIPTAGPPAAAPAPITGAATAGAPGLFANLGQKPEEKTEAPKTGGFSFGLGGANTSTTPAGSAEKTANTEAPKTGFSFANLAGAPTTGDKPSTGFNFGDVAKEKPAEVQKTGFSFGAPSTAAPAAAAAAPASGTATGEKPAGTGGTALFSGLGGGGSSLFGKPAEKTPTTGATSGTTPAIAAPVGATGVTPATTSGTTGGVGGAGGAGGVGAGVTVSEPAPNLLRGKTLEDIVDAWNKDLDIQVKEVERQAGEVKEWDRVLVKNGAQITTLHRQTLEAQQTQASVDKMLDVIESQQKELDAAMTHYEREMQVFMSDTTRPLVGKLPADKEREKSYALAEDLTKQLDDLSLSLTNMIQQVNNLSSTPTVGEGDKTEDPIDQLSAILGAHLRALNTIDGQTGKLESKVEELEGKMNR